MNTLGILANAHASILQAEIAALLHNLGKLSEAFLAYQRYQARRKDALPELAGDARFANYNYQAIAGVVAELVTSPDIQLASTDWQRLESSAEAWLDSETARILPESFRQWLQKRTLELPPPLDDRPYAIGDFIAFQAYKWYEPKAMGQRILLLFPAGSKATELLEAAHDVASGGEKEGAWHPYNQVAETFYRSTAFGWESPINPDQLEQSRHVLTTSLLSNSRENVMDTADWALSQGLGDTRWPINEVTLWDLCHSTASLFKSTLAQLVLDGVWQSQPHGKLRWRLLHISFDGLAFWGKAHHVTDLLGRRQALHDGLDAVQNMLEIQYPLGNEIYRDENGSVFVMPDVDDLLELETRDGCSLKARLEQIFDECGVRGELSPEIEVSGPYRGKQIDLAGVLAVRRRMNTPRPDAVADWWDMGQRSKGEVCTVCGLRPVGYIEPGLDEWVTAEKAERRNVCGVCLHRRGRRARDWARNDKVGDEKPGPFERTIWTDEVADDNGRFALIVGRFDLAGWLDGRLIPTMRKSVSFARIRRCWETTRQFWQEVQDEILPDKVGRRLRLGIRPANADEIGRALGRWHACEAEVNGRRLGLCWDPNDEKASDRNLFWTTDNLRYLGRQLGFEKGEMAKLEETWNSRLNGQTLALYEPGGYLGQDRRASVDAETCVVAERREFAPYIPILTEPSTFMALVPADKALAVAQAIKGKYEREMARVRDRLPLHLGLVFAPRRTPLRAVLEAGRAMLGARGQGLGAGGWEEWQAEAVGRKVTLRKNGRSLRWEYPATMGDGQTPDIWYAHLLRVDPRSKTELRLKDDGKDGDFAPVDNLTGTVWIRPSRFDFEFLDTTARRFEITYQTSGVSETPEIYRPARPSRPFYLDDLDRLEAIWEEMKRLEKSQRQQVIAAIEATREAWFGTGREQESWKDPVFRQFVRDTLAGAAWPKGHKWADLDDGMRADLENAAVRGELADWAELHQEILKE